jgi:predicted SprT family Zn-dependent metalloprotease
MSCEGDPIECGWEAAYYQLKEKVDKAKAKEKKRFDREAAEFNRRTREATQAHIDAQAASDWSRAHGRH